MSKILIFLGQILCKHKNTEWRWRREYVAPNYFSETEGTVTKYFRMCTDCKKDLSGSSVYTPNITREEGNETHEAN